jgi:hypothetical protein
MTESAHSEQWTTWRNLIGDFMMEFSEIEYISYSLWGKVLPDKNPSHNFKERTRQIISQLNGSRNIEVKKYLERATELADKRNTIAHNPALLQIFINEETNVIYRELAISTFSEGDYIDLPEIKELTTEARDIKVQLYMKLGYLPQENNNA